MNLMASTEHLAGYAGCELEYFTKRAKKDRHRKKLTKKKGSMLLKRSDETAISSETNESRRLNSRNMTGGTSDGYTNSEVADAYGLRTESDAVIK